MDRTNSINFKKLLGAVLVTVSSVTAVWADVRINLTNFPDANFRNWLLSQDYGSDGMLTDDEISKITSIDVYNKNICSLDGIEYFTALSSLSCNHNSLTSLDVSKNISLTKLYCHYNKLTKLDVSSNTSLRELHCCENKLTELYLPFSKSLQFVDCSCNPLTTLDVSRCIALRRLYCQYCNLTALDLSKNIALKDLWCYQSSLKMDVLLASLPNVHDGEKHEIRIDPYPECNMTSTQVTLAKSKGWTPIIYNKNKRQWEEYIVDDTAFNEQTSMNNVPTNSEHYPNFPKIGEKFRELILPDVDDKMVKLSDYCGKGHYTLLVFGIHPCMMYYHDLIVLKKKLYKLYHSYDFDIVAVNSETSKESWQSFIRDARGTLKYPWPFMADYQSNGTILRNTYGIRLYPCYFLLDPQGVIIETGIGPLFPLTKSTPAESTENMRNRLKQLLGFEYKIYGTNN